ncbi:MAG: HDOD domain-containing protein [Gallionella sp.]|nr:HDOD domain-containing protein [Gallionella sp.]MDD4947227.1 HDOD domain-containing protein [Gallionella sp.]
MTELSSEMSQRLASAVEKMPAFPKSVQRILELTGDINCDPRELIQVIEKDPVMTMKLLRILNSAYFSFSKQITSVNQSVVYLGLNTVKNLALSFAAMGTLPRQNAAGFDVERYLLHSLTTANLARTLCQRYGKDDTDPGDCYIAGLLHDFGKVVFAQFLAEEFRRALALSAEQSMPLYLAEREVIGTDHTVVGGMLVEKWQFPQQLVNNIRHHHDACLNGNTVQNCLFAANQISKQLAPGCGGDAVVEAFPDALQAYFGGDLQGLIASLGDLSGLLSEASLFARMSRED